MIKKTFSRLTAWHKTRLGLLVYGLIELALAYVSFSLAVNLGNFLLYFLMAFLVMGCIGNWIQLIGALSHGGRPATKQS